MMRSMQMIMGGSALLIGSLLSCTASSPFMHPRMPEDRLIEVRAMTNPFPSSQKVIAEGQALYEGKGLCVRCHGIYGDGKGIGADHFHTPPRNFRHEDFWKYRTQGELFWIIKNGSPKTGMLEFQSLLSDQEIWKILRYAETFPNRPEPPKDAQQTKTLSKRP